MLNYMLLHIMWQWSPNRPRWNNFSVQSKQFEFILTTEQSLIRYEAALFSGIKEKGNISRPHKSLV